MRLRNTTDLPDELVRAAIRFACPPGVTRYDVELRNLRYIKGSCAGRAYWCGSGYHDRADPFVVCRVSLAGFPRLLETSASHLGRHRQWLGSREEALVWILAHELRHLWQARVRKGRRVWGAKGRFSELDANAYALSRLRAWRKISRIPLQPDRAVE